ncbi:MAG: response regulator, partial [bacterium]|nr:response regulator [bacterium]
MKKILLIDDDRLFQKTLKDSLVTKDYEVKVANDGEEGLKITKKEKPDLILLDVLMPNIGGMEFLKII